MKQEAKKPALALIVRSEQEAMAVVDALESLKGRTQSSVIVSDLLKRAKLLVEQYKRMRGVEIVQDALDKRQKNGPR